MVLGFSLLPVGQSGVLASYSDVVADVPLALHRLV